MQVLKVGVFVLLLALSATAQLPTATILGTVKDSSGAIVPGVTVTVTNQETGVSRTTTAAEDGSYRFAALQVGLYAVRAEQPGFRTQVQTDLQITVGQDAVLNFTLEVGALAETVSVTAEAPMVNTTSGTLGSLVSERTIADLPLNGRNYQDLTLLQTGVVQNQEGSGRTANGIQFSSNGAPVRSNLFMIDGTIMNDVHGYGGSSTNDVALGVEGIREFKVVTNAFSAEYGLTMGSQITIVTKGGTNEVHGSLFEYFRNSALDARNWTDVPDKAPLRQNNFGGSLGGPIQRDKTFYFFTYEGLRQRRSMSPGLGSRRVPTMAARNGDINGDGIAEITVAPAVRPYLQYWPAPNDFDPLLASQGIGIYNFVSHPKAREDYLQGRVDWIPSTADNFFARYTLNDSDNAGNDPLLRPELANSKYISRNQWLTVSDSHTFSPALVGTFRGSYSKTNTSGTNRLDFPQELSFVRGEKLGGFGIANIADYTNVGPNSEFGLHQRLLSGSGDIFYTAGKHAYKFGTLWNAYSQFVNNRSGADPRGLWSFTDLASFLRAQPTSFGVLTPGSITERTWNFHTLGFYFQDDYRVSSRLTLNLGLRYEFTTQVKEANGNGAALRDIANDAATTPGIPFRNNTLRNISPRLGFAIDLTGDGRTALRGGAALLYDIGIVGSSFFIASSGTPPLSTRSVVQNPAPVFGPFPVIPESARGKTIRTIHYDLQQPKLYSYNLTLERQLPFDMALTAAYAGSRGFHLMSSPEGNPIIPQGTPAVVNGQRTCLNVLPSPVFDPSRENCWVGSSALTPGPIQLERRVNTNWDNIDFRSAESNSWYDSLQVGVTKRLSSGLQFQSSYTWSHTLDEGQGQGQDAGGGGCQNAFNLQYCKGSAGIDRRHVWNFNAIYRFPSRWTGFVGTVANGWWASTIVTWNSGTPFTPSMAFNRSLATGPAGGGGGRPDLVAGVNHKDITRGVSRGCQGVAQGTPLGTTTLFFDPCAFSIPVRGFLGNMGRNVLYGPNYSNVNFSMVKNTGLPQLGDNTALEFRVEVFNIFNHPSFSNPSSQVFTARANNPAPYSEVPVATVGRVNNTRSEAREIQLALKITF